MKRRKVGWLVGRKEREKEGGKKDLKVKWKKKNKKRKRWKAKTGREKKTNGGKERNENKSYETMMDEFMESKEAKKKGRIK